MSTFAGNRIVRNGLVLNLDPANIKNYTLSQVEVLVVAGGGSGGGSIGSHGGSGGGGAGGLIYSPYYAVTANTPITVTIGAGGTAATPNLLNNGNIGANSVFGSINAIGGGYGAHGVAGTNTPGGNGGSGGGGGYRGYNNADNWGLGISGQGNNGGGVSSVSASGGGGGGAGGVGNRNTGSGSGTGGLGGDGLSFIISGNIVTYATGGNGGTGVLSNGTPNSGNGGSGTYAAAATYSGGSGIVIVRYNGPQKASGGTVTKVGNDTVHTFTTSGTFTPFAAPVSGNNIIGLTDLQNGIFGTAVNNPTYSSSNAGSILFNGSNTSITVLPSSLMTNVNATIEGWFYTTSKGGGIGFSNGGGWVDERFVLYFGYGTGTKINLVTSNATNYNFISSTSDLPINTWCHICGIYDGAGKIYLNGKLDGSGSIWQPLLTGIPFYIGKTIGLTPDFFGGNIGSVKIYNRALSAAEIAQNFEALRGRYGI